MSTTEESRQVHTRIGDVQVPAAVAERIEELERQIERYEQIDRAEIEARATDKTRIYELETIVEKLPKTADGVPVVPGMKVWGVIDDEIPMFIVEIVRIDEIVGRSERGGWSFNQSSFQCYSTRAAAEAALKGAGT